MVGNILGADAGTYVVVGGAGADEEPARCTCGFSAVVNRRRAHRAGLFYEVGATLYLLTFICVFLSVIVAPKRMIRFVCDFL